MASCVLDASALIAFLFQEIGGLAVEKWIPGALMSTVNHSEVVAKALEEGMSMETIDFEIGRLPLDLVPFDETLSKMTASLKAPSRGQGLSMADRACLALALDRSVPLISGDRDLAKTQLVQQIILFR